MSAPRYFNSGSQLAFYQGDEDVDLSGYQSRVATLHHDTGHRFGSRISQNDASLPLKRRFDFLDHRADHGVHAKIGLFTHPDVLQELWVGLDPIEDLDRRLRLVQERVDQHDAVRMPSPVVACSRAMT